MPYFLKGDCVYKGTKEEPGELVKCHDDHEAAVAHMKALYANVEEEEKGSASSGWHGPKRGGTHTAENAPNFAGGPGADRKYGTESDEPPEGSKQCKCTKCDSTFTLPKGKQCQDVECPGCGGSATQTSPRRDKPAEGEEGGGQGGRSKQATYECVCPECEKSVYVPVGQPSDEVPCPDCGTAMKAMSPGPTIHGEGGSMGEVSSVMDSGDGDNCKCPHCGKELPCTAKACPHCKQTIDRVDTEAKSGIWTAYKSADGTWRWLSISSWAVVDKEREVVSEQAYRDAIAYAQKEDDWGQLDLVHVNGTDVGECDTLFILKGGDEPAKLGASGTWHDTAKATRARKAIQAEPSSWGMSLKFRYNPQRLVGGIYTGDIQVLKHSVLPQAMAASYGTAIAVQGGNEMEKQLDEKATEALRALGQSEEDIAELAQKAKALPEEENVVTKQEETTEKPPERAKIWEQLGKWFGVEPSTPAPEPEVARKADEVTTPAEETEKVETEPEPAPAQPDPADMMKAMGEALAGPIGEAIKEQLDERDKRIGDLEAQVKALGSSIEEKVLQHVSNLPPVVTVAASQVAATAVQEKPKGLTFGRDPDAGTKLKKALVDGIIGVVDEKVKGAGFQV